MEVRRILSQEYSMIIDGENVAIEDGNHHRTVNFSGGNHYGAGVMYSYTTVLAP